MLCLKNISEIWILSRLFALFPGHPNNAEISGAWRGQFRAHSSTTKAFQFPILGNLSCGSSSGGDKLYTTGGLGHYKLRIEIVTQISGRYRYLQENHKNSQRRRNICRSEAVCEMWSLGYGFLETTHVFTVPLSTNLGCIFFKPNTSTLPAWRGQEERGYWLCHLSTGSRLWGFFVGPALNHRLRLFYMKRFDV